MCEIIIAVAAKVVEYLVAPVGRQFNYLGSRESNFTKLKNEVQKLKDAKADVHDRVDDAQKNVKKIKPNVEKWQDSVNKIVEEAEQFIEEKENPKNRCFKGLNLNLITSYKHNKKASEKVKVIAKLLQEEKEFGEIARTIIPEDIWFTSTKDYEAFESRMSPLNDILKALKDAEVNMIGVYGMGGIGKTTLVQEVGRQAKKDKLFNEVVFVEISDTPDTKKIQEVIAVKLGLEFNNETERASKLYARLRNEKKILIILDNIWADDLDLKKIGIPIGDDHEGCKLLLTTRDHNVLESMGAKPFLVNVLNEEEGWSLFKKMIGDYIQNREWKPIAIDVIKECGGLPIAIVTIAKALRKKSVSEWKDALRQLRRPSPTNFKGVLAKAYSTIELSYTYLTDELKQAFLLCSLMVNNASILHLLKYAMGLDLLEGDIPKMEDARNRLDKLVRELKDSCLLLDGYTDELFSMHDVVRAVAISIAHRDHHVITVQNDDMMEWSNKDKLEKCTKISSRSSNINELPEVLECSQLELFHMNTRESCFRIPDNFFIRMEKLKVLGLIKMQLLSLPSSLRLLINLRTLCLDSSKLEDIAIIGELKKLKILSLRGSKIKELSREIGQLTQLRLLDLSNCSQLKVIAPNVISNLSRLEELYMRNCSIEWEVEGLKVERCKASLDELKHLSCLTTLEIDIEDDKILPKCLFSKELDRYQISIGGGTWDWFRMKRDTSRVLKVKLNSSICVEELQFVIKNVEELYLDRLEGVKNVLFELDQEGFPQLKLLQIQNNPNFLYIVDSKDLVPHDALTLLESLFLSNLINLEKISHRQLKMESFSKLKFIKVKNCRKLENIFSFSRIIGLPQLQDITVMDCQNMKEVFAIEGEDDVNDSEVVGNIEFHQLRSIYLSSLPRLTNFYSKVETSSTSEERLKELEIESQSSDIILKNEFDTPTSLFNAKDVFPNLEELKLHNINSEKIWHSQQPMSSYQNLSSLILRNCKKLKYVFSASMIKSLEQLQHLEIRGCNALTDIISQEAGTEAVAKFVFPQITFLSLQHLRKLKTFYLGIHTLDWPMLKKLEVCNCDKVKIFSSEYLSFHEYDGESQLEIIPMPQSRFQINCNLEELSLGRDEIMMILQDQFPENFFHRLKVLEVQNDRSTNFLVEILHRFKNLEKLKLSFNSYKYILSSRQDEKDVGTLVHIKNLEIHFLDELEFLWKQDSILDSIFQNLEILSVSYCEELVNILPSPTSFRNLMILEVRECNGLLNLVMPSTAKSLVQLREMKIEKCLLMKEIVENEEDEIRDEIAFVKLKSLYLCGLESLTSFCSGNYTFKFPTLEELIVDGCPEMKTFSGGMLSTPRLQKVKQNRWSKKEGCWEGDLNTTIQQLPKKVISHNSEKLRLGRR